ncbi:MAG TPA: 4'-phosphopantetheinyl transferase superfamily protein [Anaerohalosphaeraceae bacterium]|nr:4'-phosphopantetheinyl transferase superfamily protein [Anaerohalosphaeraceae bacterium]
MKTLTQHNPDAVLFKPQTPLTAPRPDEVVVYWANVDEWNTSLELLSETELHRAGQYVHAHHRDRFIVRRSLLRRLLSAFLDRPAHAVSILSTAEGKPGLNPAEHPSAIQFSLSHSHGIAAFAFTAERRIGIDIEKIDPDIELLPLARQYFTAGEASYLEHLEPQARLLAFYQCWTRKEAYLKAAGIRPLNSFDTGLQTNQILDALAPEQNQRWSMHALDLPAGWAGSFVIESTDQHPIKIFGQELYPC